MFFNIFNPNGIPQIFYPGVIEKFEDCRIISREPLLHQKIASYFKFPLHYTSPSFLYFLLFCPLHRSNLESHFVNSANLLSSILIGIPCLSFFRENNAFLCLDGKPVALSVELPFSRIRGDNFILLHYIRWGFVKIGSFEDYRIIYRTSGRVVGNTTRRVFLWNFI